MGHADTLITEEGKLDTVIPQAEKSWNPKMEVREMPAFL
jgi:hypothetical protein